VTVNEPFAFALIHTATPAALEERGLRMIVLMSFTSALLTVVDVVVESSSWPYVSVRPLTMPLMLSARRLGVSP
jgi:hypothetical protein